MPLRRDAHANVQSVAVAVAVAIATNENENENTEWSSSSSSRLVRELSRIERISAQIAPNARLRFSES